MIAHPAVKRVFYPGLESHPHYAMVNGQRKPGAASLPFTVLPRPTLSDLMSEALRRREDSASTERLEPPETETFTKPD